MTNVCLLDTVVLLLLCNEHWIHTFVARFEDPEERSETTTFLEVFLAEILYK